MGCYDTICFGCPDCGEELSGQSKSGDCVLKDYPHISVPRSVADDANRHAPFVCDCGSKWIFGNIPDYAEAKVSLTLEKVK